MSNLAKCLHYILANEVTKKTTSVVNTVMVESSKGHAGDKDQQKGLEWNTPFERDMIPLEDLKEGRKPITVATPVRKVMCGKTLNRGAVKTIITKA